MISIRDRIVNSPELQAARAARDLDALAAGLNAQGVTAPQSRFVSMRTIASALPDDSDAMIAGVIKAAVLSPTVNEMLNFLRSETGIDVNDPGTPDRIAKLVTASVWTQDHADKFNALAMQPVIVGRLDVEAAMYNSDGTEKTE